LVGHILSGYAIQAGVIADFLELVVILDVLAAVVDGDEAKVAFSAL
jgi:hypothetical protein